MNKTEEKNGVPKSDAYNQYLAYHQGHAGFEKAVTVGSNGCLRLLLATVLEQKCMVASCQLVRSVKIKMMID